MTGAFLKFDRATLPFLKIDMRNQDPPPPPPSRAPLLKNDDIEIQKYCAYFVSLMNRLVWMIISRDGVDKTRIELDILKFII